MTKPIDELTLDAWLDYRRSGQKAALLTLVQVDGSAPRPIGSQIAVSANGDKVGYITGGCAEASLVTEALDAIAENENRIRRYGEGSPYMDVQLPCGAGIDVHIAVDLEIEVIAEVVSALTARRKANLVLDLANAGGDGAYRREYAPRTQLAIVGKGPVTPALARLGAAAGMSVNVQSPEPETLEAADAFADIATPLTTPHNFSVASLDEWTAAAVLFHEHDWDPPILAGLLKSPCFYVGALGSRKTHAERVETLRALGVEAKEIARVSGPIGIDIRAKSPEEIAVSIIAEVIGERRRTA